MDVQILDAGTVVLGPCPGCQSWQIDYNLSMPMMMEYVFSAEEFELAMEFILREHLLECVHLQRAFGSDWESLL